VKWPLVSRERYDERVADIQSLRTELAAERERNQRLWNFLNWRTAGGVAFDTNMLPDAYQPRVATVTPKTEGAGVETIRGVRGPGQARRDLGLWEADRQQDFERATVGSRPARVTEEQTQQAATGD
jgi:hypothetical protein